MTKKLPLTAAATAVAALTLAGCGTSGNIAGTVAWTGTPGTPWLTVDASAAPACSGDNLRITDQKWDGTWNGQATGGFSLKNAGNAACELAVPTTIAATTSEGTTGFEIGSTASGPLILPVGDAARVGLASPNSCGKPELESASFHFTFGTTEENIDPAIMPVQCGGKLVDFSDEELKTEPAPAVSDLQATVIAPSNDVKPGETATFAVEITNPTAKDISLANCPSYTMGLKGNASVTKSYQLNCAAAGDSIKANSTTKFEMKYTVPKTASSGMTQFLTWHLLVPSNPNNPKLYASAKLPTK